MTARNPNATYACINKSQAITMEEIKGRSICIDGDIGSVLGRLGRQTPSEIRPVGG